MNRRDFLRVVGSTAWSAAAVDLLEKARSDRLKRVVKGKPNKIDKLWLAPWKVMKSPDPWQKTVLGEMVTRHDNVMMLCSRGAGKTEAVAAANYVESQLGGFGVVLSKSDRQALRVIRRVRSYHTRHRLRELIRDTMHDLEWEGGGRVIALPCREDTIRGEHGVTLLTIDEASRVPDEFWAAVTPMIGPSKGRVALLTTPFGKRGFAYKEWTGEGDEGWKRHRYPWHVCPRITREHIERERRRHGDVWVRQEYLDCEEGEEWLDVAVGLFNVDRFEQCIDFDMELEDL